MSGLAPTDVGVSRRRPRNNEADAVMAMMTKAIEVSRLQLRRLKKDIERYHHLTSTDSSASSPEATTEGEFLASSAETRTALHADLHLLFMKIHEADQLLSRLKHLMPHEPELARMRNRHRAFIKKCEDNRRHLEKVDAAHLSDTGNLSERNYSFHGRRIDIGPELERNVEDLFKDVVSYWVRIRDRQRKIRALITRGRPL